MDPERWLVLEARRRGPEAGEARPGGGAAGDAALARALLALGGVAVQEEGGWMRTHLPPPEGGLEAFLEAARRRVRAATGTAELRWRWEEGEDWTEAWRRGLEPRRVGRSLVVSPPWCDPEPSGGRDVVWIDPGMAFGTGEHGSTRGVLELLEGAVSAGDRVLDVGSGSGILSVAAVRLGARRVVAVEQDGDAVEAARRNLRRNDVQDSVILLHAEADGAFLSSLRPAGFQVVAANLLTPSFDGLLGPLGEVTASGGQLLVGGVLEEEAGAFREEVRRRGWPVTDTRTDDGWWSAALRP